jgi:phenylacetate-coenzyme A ligase PaaK-like adenylate-forming protein
LALPEVSLNPLRRAQDYVAARRVAAELAARERWPAERISAFQQERLDSLVRHAAANSPFYRDLYSGIDLSGPVQLSDLPVTSKALLMDNFDRVVIDDRLKLDVLEPNATEMFGRYYLGSYMVHSSTGSSGRKGLCVSGPGERSLRMAVRMRRWAMLERLRRRGLPERETIFSSTPDMEPRLFWTLDLNMWPIRRQVLDFRDRLSRFVVELNAFRPQTIFGTPSQMALLAAEQLDGRLGIQPTLVKTQGEVCTKEIKARIVDAWGVEPYDEWGFCEGGGVLAGDCRHHTGLHLFSSVCIIEVVDEENRPVPPGVTGDKLLATTLEAYAMPRIRFEIPDFVSFLGEKCPCGRTTPLISVAEGRREDLLTLPGPDGKDVFIHQLHFRNRIASIPGIKEYQVVYDGRTITIRAVLRSGAAGEPIVALASQRLRESLAHCGAVLPTIEIRIVEGDQLERDPRHQGKLKFVIDKRPRPARR